MYQILKVSVTPSWTLRLCWSLPSAGGMNRQTRSGFVLQPPKHHKTRADPAQLPAGNQLWHRGPTSSHGRSEEPKFPPCKPQPRGLQGSLRSWESHIDTQTGALGSGMANQWGGIGQEPRIWGFWDFWVGTCCSAQPFPQMLQQSTLRQLLPVALILNKCLLNTINGFKMF